MLSFLGKGENLQKLGSAKVPHKRVFALLTPETHSYEMAQVLQKPVFALSGLSADECEHPLVWYLGAGQFFKSYVKSPPVGAPGD